MPEKTVITKVNELGENGGISLFFPQNKVLYVDQLTGDEPETPEERAVFNPSSISDVFDYYRPRIKEIPLMNEEGESFCEDFKFTSINDFDDDKLILQSETLSNSLYKRDTYNSIIYLLERNRDLRKLLNDPEGRKALKGVLKAMREELSEK